nr:UFGT15 [Fagopyrum tataricum]
MGSENQTDNHEISGSRSPPRVPHVVVVPYPSQGHINPLLQFAKRLSSLGLKTTLASTTTTATTLPAGISVEIIADNLGSSPVVGQESDFLSSLKSNGSETLARLIERHARTDSPVCCVVYDAFLPWALDVARAHGVRGAAFFTNSAIVSALFRLVHGGRLHLPLEVEEVMKVVPGGGITWETRDLPSFLTRPESYPAYLEMKLSQFGNLDFAHWVFCNSFDDLESQVLKGIVPDQFPAKLIGPMVPSAYLDNAIEGDKGYGASLWKPLSHQCRTWLDSKPIKSVVYISFGSMASLTREQTSEIATTLIEHDFPFLWIVRESQLDTLPDGFFESTKEKGMVATWCDQLEVLVHPSLGCFVTHCGWNSTLEGLCLGVPMVGVPQWTDQFTDAKFVSDVWRVGVRARVDEVGMVRKAELAACLAEVMVDGKSREEMYGNGIKWKELAKKALSKEGSSSKNIDEFVKELRA